MSYNKWWEVERNTNSNISTSDDPTRLERLCGEARDPLEILIETEESETNNEEYIL